MWAQLILLNECELLSCTVFTKGSLRCVQPQLPASCLELRCLLEGTVLSTDRTLSFLLSTLTFSEPCSVMRTFTSLVSQSVNEDNNIPEKPSRIWSRIALEIFTVKTYLNAKWHYHWFIAFALDSDNLIVTTWFFKTNIQFERVFLLQEAVLLKKSFFRWF